MHTDGNTNYGVAPSPNTEAYPDDVLAAWQPGGPTPS
jgi:hypothetical protein